MTTTSATAVIAPDDRRSLALPGAMFALTILATTPLTVRAIGAPTMTVVFYRLWLVQPIMIGVAKASGAKLDRKLLRLALAPGILLAAAMAFGFASITRTSIANSSLIPALLPAVMLVVAARVFGERANGRQYVLATASLLGMAIVVLGAGKTSGAHLSGDLLALANLGLYCVYFVRAKQVRNSGVSASSYLAGVFFIAAVAITPLAIISGENLWIFDFEGWPYIFLLLATGATGHLMMTWAQAHLTMTLASLLTVCQPVVSTFLAWLVYDEQLTLTQVAGAAIAIGALVWLISSLRTPPPADELLVMSTE